MTTNRATLSQCGKRRLSISIFLSIVGYPVDMQEDFFLFHGSTKYLSWPSGFFFTILHLPYCRPPTCYSTNHANNSSFKVNHVSDRVKWIIKLCPSSIGFFFRYLGFVLDHMGLLKIFRVLLKFPGIVKDLGKPF